MASSPVTRVLGPSTAKVNFSPPSVACLERLFIFEKYGGACFASATDVTPFAFAQNWGDRDITWLPYSPSERRAVLGAAISIDGPCSFTAKGIMVRIAARQGRSTAQKDEKCG